MPCSSHDFKMSSSQQYGLNSIWLRAGLTLHLRQIQKCPALLYLKVNMLASLSPWIQHQRFNVMPVEIGHADVSYLAFLLAFLKSFPHDHSRLWSSHWVGCDGREEHRFILWVEILWPTRKMNEHAVQIFQLKDL